jgi:hypothetical protein
MGLVAGYDAVRFSLLENPRVPLLPCTSPAFLIFPAQVSSGSHRLHQKQVAH